MGTMCILEHHLSGVLTGTRSRTPHRTSRSRPSRTLACHANGIWAGVLIAIGLALGSTNNLSGSLSFTRGSFCLSHILKAEDENLFRMYCLITGRFASIGSQGKVGGSSGGSDLLGQLHG